MVEPTESESRFELDRFIDAMIQIRGDRGRRSWPVAAREDNLLVNAPHTAQVVASSDWAHAYPREVAAYPVPAPLKQKYWAPVGRVDNVWGDRNLFCSCVPVADYA